VRIRKEKNPFSADFYIGHILDEILKYLAQLVNPILNFTSYKLIYVIEWCQCY